MEWKKRISPFRQSRDYDKLKSKITLNIEKFKEEGNLSPQLTLFICFLNLIEFSKQRFNAITKRHLDFYYTEVLKIDKLKPTPDQVHVLFELAKNSVEERVEEGVELNGKKDLNGEQILYKTEEELIVNQATIEEFRSTYNDPGKSEFKAALASKTLDGRKEPLTEESPYWFPFWIY